MVHVTPENMQCHQDACRERVGGGTRESKGEQGREEGRLEGRDGGSEKGRDCEQR